MPTTASASVLNEDEALELLAYLITAARTQVDEAAEYGPLRLLTAARRLAGSPSELRHAPRMPRPHSLPDRCSGCRSSPSPATSGRSTSRAWTSCAERSPIT